MKYLSTLFLFLVTLAACQSKQAAENTSPTDSTASEAVQVRFVPDSALADIRQQCAFGARVPGSEAHRKCGDWMVARFKSLGLEVTEQTATVKGWDGKQLPLRNIIASYQPEAAERIIICTHWDSRPWCDNDADSSRHREPVMAANDGASGVAVMLELARLLPQLNPAFGVDFICFDAEDYGMPYWAEGQSEQAGNDWCLGSQYWAAHPHVPGYKAHFGILLDMVGGRDARFCYEGFSMRYAREWMVRTWDAAQRAGAAHLFVQQEGGYAQDDHVPLNEVAGIPTFDIIPYVEGENSFGATGHTVSDTPENSSRETLKGVGQTLLQLFAENPIIQ